MEVFALPETTVMVCFIREIGLQVWKETIEEKTFVPGVLIKHGGLAVDEDKLLYPGDLLHEAGHLAVMRPEQRATVYKDASNQPADEMMVLAWSYAAALHLGLDPEVVFHANGYKGDAAWLAEHYAKEGAVGLPMLEWIGLTDGPIRAQKNGTEPFPRMRAWLRT